MVNPICITDTVLKAAISCFENFTLFDSAGVWPSFFKEDFIWNLTSNAVEIKIRVWKKSNSIMVFTISLPVSYCIVIFLKSISEIASWFKELAERAIYNQLHISQNGFILGGHSTVTAPFRFTNPQMKHKPIKQRQIFAIS